LQKRGGRRAVLKIGKMPRAESYLKPAFAPVGCPEVLHGQL